MTTPAISLREELIFLLNQACELEHSLSCSYLFTAFSLKSADDPDLSPEQAAAVGRWKRIFREIAVEEMMHLAVVNDLLIAIGAAPNFDRPNFPHTGSYYMPDLHIELEPFSEELIRHFVAVEQPTGGDLPMRLNPELVIRIEGSLDNAIGPDPYRLASQGDIYGVALDGLRGLVERLGTENVFVGPRPTEALRGFLEGNGWSPIRDLATAEHALDLVVEQGEGGHVESLDSHFVRFSSVLNEFLELRERDPDFNPARPVLANPFARTPPEATGPVNLIDDEFTIQVSDLFNEVYGAMLQLLARFFVTTSETEKEATALESAAIQVMVVGLVPLGEMLTRLPAGPGRPGITAGPSFVVHTLHPLPHKDAAWVLLRERCRELADYTAQLAQTAPSESGPLTAVADGLESIVRLLDEASANA